MYSRQSAIELYLDQFLQSVGWSFVPRTVISTERTNERWISDPFWRSGLEAPLCRINPSVEWNSTRLTDFYSMLHHELVASSKHISNTTLSTENTQQLLRDGMFFGAKSTGEMTRIKLIDLERPENNEFTFSDGIGFGPSSEEQQVQILVPDFVLYVNGLPLCVVDVSSSTQSQRQPPYAVLSPFTQLVVRVTPERIQYLHPADTKGINAATLSSGRLLTGLETILDPQSLLDLIFNFLVMMRIPGFRESVPFLAQPYQIAAVNAALKALKSKRSGSIVLPVGSGKSQVLGLIVNKLERQNFEGQIVCVTESDPLSKQLTERLQQLRLTSIGMLSKKTPHVGSKFDDQNLLAEHSSRVVLSTVSAISSGGLSFNESTIFLMMASVSPRIERIRRNLQAHGSVITISDDFGRTDAAFGIDDLLYEYSLSDMVKAGQRCAVSLVQAAIGDSPWQQSNYIAEHFEAFKKRGAKGFALIDDDLLSVYEEAFNAHSDYRFLFLDDGSESGRKIRDRLSPKELNNVDVIVARRLPAPEVLAPVQVAYVCSDIEQSDDLIRLIGCISQKYPGKRTCSIVLMLAPGQAVTSKLEQLGVKFSEEFVKQFHETLILAERLCQQFDVPVRSPSDSAKENSSDDVARSRLDEAINQLQELVPIVQLERGFHELNLRYARVLQFYAALTAPKSKVTLKKRKPVSTIVPGELTTEGKLTPGALAPPFEREIRDVAARISHECDAASIAIKVSTKLIESTTINWHRRSDVILKIISSLTVTLVSANFPESSIAPLVRKLVDIATKLQLQIDAETPSS